MEACRPVETTTDAIETLGGVVGADIVVVARER